MTSQTFTLLKRVVSSNSIWALAGLNQILPVAHPLRDIAAQRIESKISKLVNKVPSFALKILRDGLKVDELTLRDRNKLQQLDLKLQGF